IRIHDPRTNLTTNLGFSIKSSLGSLSSLFNSGKTTNFLYEIVTPEGFNPEIVNDLDTKPKYKSRIERLENEGCKIAFRDVESGVFKQNLIMIDSLLPCLLGKVLYYYYSGRTKPGMISVLELLKQLNPMHFDLSNSHPIYEHKLRTMLTDMALGMTSGTVWNGRYTAVGGFIIVKEDGDIICYHVYDKDEFQDFLMHHSKLDIPDSGRHEFGKVFKDGDRYFIKLNLQIRYST
ncbi:MAG: HpaII family restriction endonuclease, partial [Chlorobiota bacterium]